MDDASAGLGDIPKRVSSLRARYSKRDEKVRQLRSIRKGEWQEINPDLFNVDWPEPVVANTIDEAARAYAAKLGSIMPAVNCIPERATSESAKQRADKRTKVANNYLASSKMSTKMYTAGDNLGTFGLAAFCVYPDFKAKMPKFSVESVVGCYPVWDAAGRTVEVAFCYRRDWFAILADYPDVTNLTSRFPAAVSPEGTVEVVKYCNKDRECYYIPSMGNAVLENIPNVIGECYYVVVKLPYLDMESVKGLYDDVVFVQLARHALQMDLMSGVDQAVNAPLVVGPDVVDVPTGPGAVIRSQNGPASVGRVRLDMPQQAFGAVEQLKQEMYGSANPESMSGSTDASVITGRGLQELSASFNGEIAVGQSVLQDAVEMLVGKAFKMDEKLWPNEQKTARGDASGVPFEVQYTPSKDIDGRYDVQVTYGYAAGLDANRALILLLQLNGAGALSRDSMMRNSPIAMNVTEETQKIDMEHLRDSEVQALAAFAQAIPQMAAAGQDPSGPLQILNKVIVARAAGKTIEEAVAAAFAPPPQQAPTDASGTPQAPPGAPNGGGVGPGSNLVPNLATEGPNGRPDLQEMMAGIGAGGKPQLSARVSRMSPVAGT